MFVCIGFICVSCAFSQPSPSLPVTEIPPITLTLWLVPTSTALLPTLSAITATPPAHPIATLTPIIYEMQVEDTLPQIAIDFGVDVALLQTLNPDLSVQTPAAGQIVMIPPAAATLVPQPLTVMPPTCYLSTDGAVVCLGTITNHQPDAVSRVSVRVDIVDRVGTIRRSEVASIEQRVIPAGEIAPYRVIFDALEDDLSQMIVSLQSADLAPTVQRVGVSDEQASFENGYYRLRATLHPSDQGANVRVVVTLYDEQQRIIGYRIVDLAATAHDKTSIPLLILIKPLVSVAEGAHITHTLYAEQWTDE